MSCTTTRLKATSSGPTFSFRGIDNSVYYRLDPDDPRHHVDFTGTGNSLNIVHPRTMALIMDSLRYWVTDMHVDGFRFDLAPVLVRGIDNERSPFFEIIQQDPVLSQVKLIAEPWDVGPDGYQLGRFPERLGRMERGVPRQCEAFLAWRSGSSPGAGVSPHRLRATSSPSSGRRTYASVNFVTCHDGFTLSDVVGFDRQAQRGQRRRQPGRYGRELQPATGARKGDTNSLRIQRLRERIKEEHARHAVLLARGPYDAGRRRDRPQPAGQQQCVLPGQRDQLVELEPRRASERPL